MTVGAAERLDVALVRRGLARSRQRASDLVAAGHVLVSGVPARKVSQPVEPEQEIVVDVDDDYVGRGAQKLVGALDATAELVQGGIVVRGAWCLDAGASTGGFTDVLLRRGATHVDAVDVGHGQLAEVLRSDPRVSVHEGVNVRELTPGTVGQPPDLLVADLSFISLRTAVPALVRVAAPRADLVLLVKPQFEVGRRRLASSGVVTAEEDRIDAVVGVARACIEEGVAVVGVVPSILPGETGNREYFLWARRPPTDSAAEGTAPSSAGTGAEHRGMGDAELVVAVGRAVGDGVPVRVGEVS